MVKLERSGLLQLTTLSRGRSFYTTAIARPCASPCEYRASRPDVYHPRPMVRRFRVDAIRIRASMWVWENRPATRPQVCVRVFQNGAMARRFVTRSCCVACTCMRDETARFFEILDRKLARSIDRFHLLGNCRRIVAI